MGWEVKQETRNAWRRACRGWETDVCSRYACLLITYHVERRVLELVEVHEVALGHEALVDARHLSYRGHRFHS